MVERFNGRISEVVGRTRFQGARDLQQTLERYLLLYNQHIPQKALNHRTPLEAMRQWQKTNRSCSLNRLGSRPEPDT